MPSQLMLEKIGTHQEPSYSYTHTSVLVSTSKKKKKLSQLDLKVHQITTNTLLSTRATLNMGQCNTDAKSSNMTTFTYVFMPFSPTTFTAPKTIFRYNQKRFCRGGRSVRLYLCVSRNRFLVAPGKTNNLDMNFEIDIAQYIAGYLCRIIERHNSKKPQ